MKKRKKKPNTRSSFSERLKNFEAEGGFRSVVENGIGVTYVDPYWTVYGSGPAWLHLWNSNHWTLSTEGVQMPDGKVWEPKNFWIDILKQHKLLDSNSQPIALASACSFINFWETTQDTQCIAPGYFEKQKLLTDTLFEAVSAADSTNIKLIAKCVDAVSQANLNPKTNYSRLESAILMCARRFNRVPTKSEVKNEYTNSGVKVDHLDKGQFSRELKAIGCSWLPSRIPKS